MSTPGLPDEGNADAEPDYVAVPAYPAVNGEQKDIRFELREGPDGSPVGVAFSTVDRLVEQLGRFQPWIVLKTSGLRELLSRIEVSQILLNPMIKPETAQWSADAVTTLAEVNDHGGL